MQLHTVCSQSCTLVVGGDESTDDGAVHDAGGDVTLKENATSAGFKECKESSGAINIII